MKNFWGVYAYVFHLMQLYVHFDDLLYMMSLARTVRLSM